MKEKVLSGKKFNKVEIEELTVHVEGVYFNSGSLIR
jgi:hypothetical protein